MYPTIPIIIEGQVYESNMKYDSHTHHNIMYNDTHFNFKLKRNYVFHHTTSQVRYFINHGTYVNTRKGHEIDRPIMVNIENNIALPGICKSFTINKKTKQSKTHISFDYSDLLDPSIEHFVYPQLL